MAFLAPLPGCSREQAADAGKKLWGSLGTFVGRVGNREPTAATGKMPPPVPVLAGSVVQKPMPIELRSIGNVEAYSTVVITPQVNGSVLRVHVKPGQDVKAGEALFTIDPRPFEAALRQAEATLARDLAQRQQASAGLAQRLAERRQAEANLTRELAQLDNARAQNHRYQVLLEKELVAREQYEQIRTNALALEAGEEAARAAIENARAAVLAAEAAVVNAEAAIRADQAAVEQARLQLGYASIRSPIDGRAGDLLVDAGNVVRANPESSLLVINQVQPVYVAFSVPEQNLAEIKRYRAAGTMSVEARSRNDGTAASGELTFVNNTVDVSTGTIQLKASFANAERAFWPGQFVDVVIKLTEDPNAVVAPTAAIQAGQNGAYVYVVKSDLTVESRPVTVGWTAGPEAVIAKGLAPGERVVTDGQLRLAPGAKVDIKTPAVPGAEAKPKAASR